jgi:hypothetical protein
MANSQFTYWERADKSACAGANNGLTVPGIIVLFLFCALDPGPVSSNFHKIVMIVDCPSGQRVYAFIVSGTTMSDTSSGSVYTSATSADACARACTQNQVVVDGIRQNHRTRTGFERQAVSNVTVRRHHMHTVHGAARFADQSGVHEEERLDDHSEILH